MDKLHRGRLRRILSCVEEATARGASLPEVAALLDRSRPALYRSLARRVGSPVAARALTLKIQNLCLAKYHLRARSSAVLSRPFGLNIDPANACNLACPGCVHSRGARDRNLFVWERGALSVTRFEAFLSSYGPYAMHAVFCNYGEPLLNPDAPKMVRLAKEYLVQSMVSTNLAVPRFDPEAWVESGIDYVIASIDGATQATYERFRRNGRLDLALHNLRSLVEARRHLGRATPVVAWRFLTFRHNVHEVPAALELARSAGVDQFSTLTPHDIRWDDPTIEPVTIEPVNVLLDPSAEQRVLGNWNPFPHTLRSADIEAEFAEPWSTKLGESDTAAAPGPGFTCHWLYKSMTLDAAGRIFPCCAPPQPGLDLAFAHLSGSRDGLFNSDAYRRARHFFASPESPSASPCAACPWQKDGVNTDPAQVAQYLKASGRGLFDAATVRALAFW